MSKFVGFIIGSIEIGIGVLTGNVALIVSGTMMIVSQAVVDLTAPKQGAREASEMTIALGEQPRTMLLGETFTPGSLVDAFDYGGKYGTDWEVLIIRLADHKCHSLTGFYVNDDWNPYVADGLVPRYDDQLQIYFRADTTNDALPTIVTDNGPGWTSADIGQSGCDVIIAYKADKPNDKHPGWPGGRPHFGFVVKGAFCYDPRKDSTVSGGSGTHRDTDPTTWEWSENAVICWYKFERGVYADDAVTDPTKLLVGRGMTAAESPPEMIFAAANECDTVAAQTYPSTWTQTGVTFTPSAFSPDGARLYAVNDNVLEVIDLRTRSLIVSVAAPGGGGGTIAATIEGVYYLDGSGNLFLGTNGGTITEVVAATSMGLLVAGAVGVAGGDVWVLPHPFGGNRIGQLTGAGFSVHNVNFQATQVFTTVGGTAMAVGTSGGNILAIGTAGAAGTLLSTAVYGTTGDVYAFAATSTVVVAYQGSHMFLIDISGTPTITAAVSVSTPLRTYEGFAAVKPGAGSFWIDGTEFKSSDLSIIRAVSTSSFAGTLGGTPGNGLLYDQTNNALICVTATATGVAWFMLDRNGSYRIAGPIYANQAYIDVEQMFAAATAGSIVTRDGAVQLQPGVSQSVVATITDADLIVGSKVSWNQGFMSESSDEWLNTVVATYVEPDQKWNSHAAPPMRSTSDIAADGKPREQQQQLRLVRYQEQALRIGEIARRMGRLWGRATVTLGPRHCELEDGDWIQWTSDRYFGGATKTFRIEAYSIDGKWQNTLTLREMSAEVFADDATFPIDYSRPTMSPIPPDTGAPDAGNWTLTAVTLASPNASIPALEIAGSASDDIYVEAIIFEYWKSDGIIDPFAFPDAPSWTSAGRDAPDTTKVDITSLTGGATYYAAVSYVVNGIPGDRLILGPVTVGNLTTGSRTADTTVITADTTLHTADLG